ncbi:HK97 family phage prohead protease [Klebsiella pneumoniae]|nr:HK97 family phage prohead protease [Klebsiella pneumoniae]NGH22814.1 HK97 family phage prohead protease [Klebsiella pneumoniae]
MGAMMPDIQKTLAFDQTEINFIGDGSKGTFEGYASVFNNTDADGDIILPGAFAGVIANQSRKVAMFFNHQTRAIPVGKWDAMHEDDKGLFVRGQLTPGLSLAEDLKAAMQHGTVEGMSVGFSVGPDDYTVGTSGLIFKNISYLREISVCTFPANELAGVTAMKSIDSIKSIRDAEGWLRDSVGLSRSEAQAFIARVKSAGRSEFGSDDIDALAQRINSFAANLRTP